MSKEKAKLPVKKAKKVKLVKKVTKKAAKNTPVKKATPKKLSPLERIQQAVVAKYGAESIMQFTGGAKPVPVAFSTGIIELDEAIGIGGYPRGRVIEIYGPESSGKTTMALHAVAECQKAGGIAQFIDVENAIDPVYAENLGVNLDKCLISQPDSGEQALSIVEASMQALVGDTYIPNIIIVDSVAALTPQSEIDGDIDETKGTAELARLMSKSMRKLCGLVAKTGTVLIFINQMRDKINFMSKGGKTTPGGNALKFYASTRIHIRPNGVEKAGEVVIGSKTVVKIVKNKVARPFLEFEGLIRFGVGFDKENPRFKKLTKHKEIMYKKPWLTLPDDRKIQGFNGFLKFVEDEENNAYIDELLAS